MVGLGTIIDTLAVIIGGLFGVLFKKHINKGVQDALMKTCGIAILIIGLSGTCAGMLSYENGTITSGKTMLVVICLILGGVIGELLHIDNWFKCFGKWLKVETGNDRDKRFVNAFLTSTFTIAIGAMAIIGSINDGMLGDPSILITKSIVDLSLAFVLTCSLGKGTIFAAIPVAVLEGSMTLLAKFIKPIMTDAALANISLIGSILILCVGINLVWEKDIKISNLLPALILAVIAAFI